jgi:hypothetical protein
MGLGLLLAAPTALVAGVHPAAASTATVSSSEMCSPVNVVKAELVWAANGPAILVAGFMPRPHATLRLDAEQVVYIQQPDYWNYTVHGCGGCEPVTNTPFMTLFPVPSAQTGRFGISVNGIKVNLFGVGPQDD